VTEPWPTWIAAVSAAAACGTVSPLLAARRWGFLGEGIAHSGFGGAGVVWLLAAALPGLAFLRTGEAVAAGTAMAAFGVAAGVGFVIGRDGGAGRTAKLGFDASVAAVLAGALAIGLLAREAFFARFELEAPRGDALLFGGGPNTGASGWGEAVVVATVAWAVVIGVWLYRREILAWAFDPEGSELHGVRGPVVRYGILLAAAGAAATATPLVGAVLVTALLVLPGATAGLTARSTGQAWATSLGVAVAATATGVAAGGHLPPGPVVATVLVLTLTTAAGVIRLLRSK
jgi:ABC-type Mn2+/Zn2+ transport system permease subunit